jgi:hypothetical protein
MSRLKSSCVLFFGLAVVLAAPRMGLAALIVNEGATWPAAPTVQTFDRTADNVTSERDARFTRDLTQTFQVPSALTLDKIYIDVEEAVGEKEVTVRLFQVADVNAASVSEGALLVSQAYTTSAGINTADGGNDPLLVLELDFTGADQVALLPSVGTEGYALQLKRTGAGSELDDTLQRAFKWHYNNRSATAVSIYANGRGYAIAGGGIDAGDDFLMAIVAVPEPSRMGLAAMAAGVLFGRRRRF